MKVTYDGDAVRHVPEAGLVVHPGETVEVESDLGERLARLPDWKRAHPRRKRSNGA